MRQSAFAILFGTLLSCLLGGCATLQSPSKPKLTGHSSGDTKAVADSTSRIPDWLDPKNAMDRMKGPEPDEVAAGALFERAENQFRAAANSQGETRLVAFEEAAEIYDLAADRGHGFPIHEDALLMAAESQFFADNYPDAARSFGELVKAYPNTQFLDRVDKRRFAIAQYWLQHPNESSKRLVPNFTDDRRPVTDTFGNALKLLDRIRFDDPAGQLSDDATIAAALANFQRKKYDAADELFTDIRENFPSSEHQFQAHFLGLKCKLMAYAGPDYAGGALDDAEQLIRQMVTQFPEQSKQEYESLDKARKDVRLMKAQREFVEAKYYDRRKEYRAARIHYENVRHEFSDTSLAVEAESRLAQLDGRPDVPPPTMQWLADLFPDEPARQEPLIRPNPIGSKK